MNFSIEFGPILPKPNHNAWNLNTMIVELSLLSSLTMHWVTRSENRYTIGNCSSWKSPGAHPGLAQCSAEGRIEVGAQLTRSTHEDDLVSSRAWEISEHASGHVAIYQKHARVSRCFKSHDENSERTSGHSVTFPKHPQGSPCFESSMWNLIECFGSCGYIPEANPWRYCSESSLRKLGTCFGSSIWKFEVGSGSSIRTFVACSKSSRKLTQCLPDVHFRVSFTQSIQVVDFASSRACKSSVPSSSHITRYP